MNNESMAADLAFFADLIRRELGIVYAEHNYFQLQNRLEEISRSIGVDSVEQLAISARKQISSSLRQLLLDSATNNETSFFRDPKVFSALSNTVLPSLIAQHVGLETVRVWSAAASTGQEAVSLSILREEWLKKNPGSKIDFQIEATDVSERVLQKARTGRYTQLEVQRGLSALQIVNYMKKVGESDWQVDERLTRRISFQKQNLKEPFRFPYKFHIIFLRNVLIYQDVDGKTEILRRISECLIPGGYLVLGSGESLIGLSNDYDSHILDGAVFYKFKQLASAKGA